MLMKSHRIRFIIDRPCLLDQAAAHDCHNALSIRLAARHLKRKLNSGFQQPLGNPSLAATYWKRNVGFRMKGPAPVATPICRCWTSNEWRLSVSVYASLYGWSGSKPGAPSASATAVNAVRRRSTTAVGTPRRVMRWPPRDAGGCRRPSMRRASGSCRP